MMQKLHISRHYDDMTSFLSVGFMMHHAITSCLSLGHYDAMTSFLSVGVMMYHAITLCISLGIMMQ